MQDEFVRSPFALTASRETASSWCGRSDVLKALQRVRRSWETRADSSLDLMWASLGAGKSHALLHLKHLVEPGDSCFVAIVELPEQIRTFRDIYSRVISNLDVPVIAAAISQKCGDSELLRCLQAVVHGNHDERILATEWLRAGNPTISDLRKRLGITRRLETDSACADVLVQLISASWSSRRRVVVMFDEFQRIAALSHSARESALSSLRTLFSQCPSGLGVVLSVGTLVEATALSLLTPELRTLLGFRKPISLPALSADEAVAFVSARFQCFRMAERADPSFSPFEEDAVRHAVDLVVRADTQPLTPRLILQLLATAYDIAFEEEAKSVTVEHIEAAFAGTRIDD